MPHEFPRRAVAVALSIALCGCVKAVPTGTQSATVSSETSLSKSSGAKGVFPPAQGSNAAANAAKPAAPAAPLVSNNGASLIGVVKAPATLISNNGSGLISNNSGGLISNNSGAYRLLALAEVPVPDATVSLYSADGKPVLDDKGQPITTKTDASGNYKLPVSANARNLLVKVAMPKASGDLVALVPKGTTEQSRSVDVNLTSTLVMGYILDQYVKGDAAVLDKLPSDIELKTRVKMDAAIEATKAAAPADLKAATVVKAVSDLRQKDTTIDAQMEEVKRILLAGLSDQGAGKPVTDVETDASDVAVSPKGELYFASSGNFRVWKKDAQGNLSVVAGTGLNPWLTSFPTATQNALGDGDKATAAFCNPAAIDFMPDGKLLILDKSFKRVRVVGTDGIISTYAAHDDWTELRDMVVEADGSLVVATHSAIYRVKPDKTITLLAGEVRAFDLVKSVNLTDAGDGGAPSAARFVNIQSLATNPKNGDLFVYDFNSKVRRMTATDITAYAGTGISGYTGDGGAAKQAQLNRMGGLLVDAAGDLLIGDTMNHCLRKVSNGQITTEIAGGSATWQSAFSQRVLEPLRFAAGPGGQVYFVDSGFVRQLEGRQVSLVIGGLDGLTQKRPANQVQLLGPTALHYDAASNSLLVTDSLHLRRWSLTDNTMETLLSKGPWGKPFQDGAAPLDNNLYAFYCPLQEADGSIYAFGTEAQDGGKYAARVVRLKDGTLSTLLGGVMVPGQADVDGPAVGATLAAPPLAMAKVGDTIYYNVRALGEIRKMTIGGSTSKFAGYGTQTADGTLALNFDFGATTALAIGPDGRLYVGDAGAIYAIDLATTKVTKVAGGGYGYSGDGGPALSAKLSWPEGFAWDTAGNLYFSDYNNNKVRRLDKASGNMRLIAGNGATNLNGPTIDTGLSAPTGLAFDKLGNLYVADVRHGQIKMISADKLNF